MSSRARAETNASARRLRSRNIQHVATRARHAPAHRSPRRARARPRFLLLLRARRHSLVKAPKPPPAHASAARPGEAGHGGPRHGQCPRRRRAGGGDALRRGAAVAPRRRGGGAGAVAGARGARGRGEGEGGRREGLRGGGRGQGEVVRVRRGRGREGSREAVQAGLRARDGRRRGRRRGVGREAGTLPRLVRRAEEIVRPRQPRKCAKKIYDMEIKPLFEAAGVSITVQETEYQGHAREVASSLDLGKYDGIVCVSGDGVLVEVVNGILQRTDWEEAINMPMGVVPAGTGNGMAKSLLHAANETCSVLNAVFAIIKGHKQSLDVCTILQGEKKFFSVLLTTWGCGSHYELAKVLRKYSVRACPRLRVIWRTCQASREFHRRVSGAKWKIPPVFLSSLDKQRGMGCRGYHGSS
ncbi:hypothetical protein GQ55_5G134600 [Panicum hallii var. hallii]|uniref:DAGKc domain-containing protein n=1 Tax=Panicum hallii var. hallii TaxID=1504633 RepID=A0A2T7DFW5_9POAL|nr:hypothetical protein GQ55_5G134600 [Panicum hallii var. hallii]